jgi:hypothetical protein
MRFFEFANPGADVADKLVVILKNYVGRAASKKAPANLNWNGLQQVLQSSGFELAADYETFKSIYDTNPAVQGLVKNFNDKGIELKVPGAIDDKNPDGTKDSEDEIAQIAAGAADQQVAQDQQTPKVSTQA